MAKHGQKSSVSVKDDSKKTARTNHKGIAKSKLTNGIDDLFAAKKSKKTKDRKIQDDDDNKGKIGDDIDALFAEKKKIKKQKISEQSPVRCTFASSQHRQTASVTKRKLNGDRTDTDDLQKGQWIDDGLGGIFDKDGFTGRKDQSSGYKIYKAHLMNKKDLVKQKIVLLIVTAVIYS
eukprot:CAMPEP_0116074236 /NCGR_PEP_ID=MMETSP0322-20121206/15804_1 /TAXON_ID=163516 /ORGANISM="Leptocylindrus danicus var. apora, Strain B651" /LENGTH=176 /DNA_ID=CAMNT_0003563835 /DNA_START=214 /DNA_END=742 /DNA_ORIENTATION=+